jgi:hypothetical protein
VHANCVFQGLDAQSLKDQYRNARKPSFEPNTSVIQASNNKGHVLVGYYSRYRVHFARPRSQYSRVPCASKLDGPPPSTTKSTIPIILPQAHLPEHYQLVR